MFSCDSDEKIFQTLPGQGWRVLIQWNPDAPDKRDGFPETTLEPVIAWVTARVQRERKRDGFKWEDVIIVPLVRWPSGDDLFLVDTGANLVHGAVYLAPGEELSQLHFDQLRGGYAKAVSLG